MASLTTEDCAALPQRLPSCRRRVRRGAKSKNCTLVPVEWPTCVDIDGSMGEGGGQIIRISICLGCLMNQSVRVQKIRAGRSKPGLQRQHLTGAKLCADLVRGKIRNASLNSAVLDYDAKARKSIQKLQKQEIPKRTIVADCVTAGSVTLLMQAVLPILHFVTTPTEINLIGGTTVGFSPPYSYFQNVLFPILRDRFQANLCVRLVQEGYNPEGKGHVVASAGYGQAQVEPLQPVEMISQGSIVQFVCDVVIIGNKIAADQKVLEREAHDIIETVTAAVNTLPGSWRSSHERGDQALSFASWDAKTNASLSGLVRGVRFNFSYECRGTFKNSGIALQVYAVTSTGCILPGNALLQRKKTSGIGSEVAKLAVRTLLHELKSGACCDEHLSDQLLVFMALAKGTSKIRCRVLSDMSSKHFVTALYVLDKLVPGAKFKVLPSDDNNQTQVIVCEGVGFMGGDINRIYL